MSEEKEILRRILIWLWGRHRTTQSSLSGNLLQIHAQVSRVYRGFDERELGALFSNEASASKDFGGHGKCLFLEPETEQGMVPILLFRYDFARSIPEVRLRIALFLLDENSELRAIGYRFESPEGEGIHHYYHAQLITHFDSHRLPCPEWLPVKQPAFALDANSPSTLIVCLLISLYGFDFINELRTAPFWNFLQPNVDGKMMCISHEFQPTYWQMRIKGKIVYYKTWKQESKFKLVMRNAFEASDMERIDRRVYCAQDKEARKIY